MNDILGALLQAGMGSGHRQVKYLNNEVDADHGAVKRRIRGMLGFKSAKTAYATLEGFEVMRMIRKRQCMLFRRGVIAEARFFNKLFGVNSA